VAKLERVAPRKRGEVLGEVGLGRHLGAVDEDGDHRDVALQRRGDFDPHIVVRVVEPPLALAVGGGQPVRADDCKQRVALGDLAIELLDEVEPRLDGVDIDEERAAREFAREMIVKPPRDARRVVSPVIDEDAGHSGAEPSTTGGLLPPV
jgi:hypothetical protein